MFGQPYPGLLAPFNLSPDIPLLVQDMKSDPTGGTLAINSDKGAAKWFWLRALSNNNTFSQVLGAGGQSVVNITAPPEENLRGDYEICGLYATSTGRFSTQIFHNTINRNFQNTAVPNNLLYGTSSFPGMLPETTYLPATNGIQLTLTDLSGSSNTINIVAVGRRFLDWGNERIGDVRRRAFYGRRTHPFWLLDNRGPEYTVAGSGTATLVLNVPQDADFNCMAIIDDSDGAYDMQIFEGLSSRALMDAQISARNFVAATSQPSITTVPTGGIRAWGLGGRMFNWSHLFKRSSQINISITETSTSQNKIRLALVGQLVYYNAPQTEQLTLPENYSAQQQGLMQQAPFQNYGFSSPMVNPMGTRGLPKTGAGSGMGYIDANLFKGPGVAPVQRR